MNGLYKNKFLSLGIGFLLVVLIAVPLFAADGDIAKEEVRPDVATYQLDTIRFLVISRTCEVVYRKLDSEGNNTGEEVTVIFQNRADNPDTPEDETLTEFTQLINLINSGDNIKNSITTAVRIKLGI